MWRELCPGVGCGWKAAGQEAIEPSEPSNPAKPGRLGCWPSRLSLTDDVGVDQHRLRAQLSRGATQRGIWETSSGAQPRSGCRLCGVALRRCPAWELIGTGHDTGMLLRSPLAKLPLSLTHRTRGNGTCKMTTFGYFPL